MSFTPRSVKVNAVAGHQYALNHWQRRALLGMLGMVLVTFAAGNLWALLWQGSDWLVATILPAVVVDLTNNERVANNTRPLERNPLLDEAARAKAAHMAQEGYFAHYSPDGVSPWHWFREVEYRFAHAGENLAVHFTDSRAVVEAWMNSPTHRENIENNQFTQIGVGTARGQYNGYDTIFVVQMFGTPAAPTVAAAPTTGAGPEAGGMSAEPDDDVEIPLTEETTDSMLEFESDTIAQVDQGGGGDDSQTVSGAGADSVEENREDRAVVADDLAVAEDRSLPPQEDPEDEVVTDMVSDKATTSTTSVPYLARTEDGSVVEHSIEQWITTTHATSSGFPVASTAGTTRTGTDPLNPFAVMSTQPGALLQFVYSVLALVTAGMVLWALQLEIRRHRYVQVAYSIGLLGLMGGLWYVHESVTAGAVVT